MNLIGVMTTLEPYDGFTLPNYSKLGKPGSSYHRKWQQI